MLLPPLRERQVRSWISPTGTLSLTGLVHRSNRSARQNGSDLRVREEERQQAEFTWSRPRAPRRWLPLSSVSWGVLGETAWYSLRCIVIHPRKTHQSDSGRFSGGKTCSFVAEGAETLWGRFRGARNAVLW